mmetsp:Transcript_9264/g.21372  ORF Transcript_9264/g.21372 Transcript_9264/m.21372 type:complete len:221 (-) Transcript_9264:151-813(-)
MATEMKIAVIHNKVGVEFVKRGEYEMALHHFETAALHLYNMAHQLQKSKKRDSESSGFGRNDMSFSGTPANLQDDPLICGRPIVIHENLVSAPLSCESYTLRSAAILYNMGLTYHLSFTMPQAMHGAFANAVKMYEMAYDLVLQVPQGEIPTQIVMAVLNNLGAVHHEIGDFGRSRSYLEDLSCFISHLEDPTEEEDAIKRGEFRLNAMVLGAAHGAAAA